jgi:hypothetical protein
MRHAFPFIALLLALTGCKKEYPKPVEYVVTCGSCDLTYANSGGDTEQRSITSSWTYPFKGEKDQFLYISAQNNNSSGTVTVVINVDGAKFKNASSTGGYVIATASGSLP